MQTLVLLLFLAGASPSVAKPRSRLVRYPSWNSRMYPVWKDGDPRYKDSWKGGRVIFNVANDSPTLTGAKVTFTISLEFPRTQKLLPSGDVVWAEDGLFNGTKHGALEPVYPAQDADWEPVFPDGSPVRKDKTPNYVFVWKAWGQYWQVADDSSSSLTIATDDIPLGSYTMDIVIYHYRSREKFIPLGYASTQFSITDQIPFAVSLDQVNDIVAGDMRFMQNRAIAFTITLHDPSEYLNNADITFNWDFGDGSGALISRELTVTHTYVNTGSFKPKVVVQAVIPDKACDVPANTTKAPSPASDGAFTEVAPAVVSAVPKLVSIKATGLNVKVDPSDAEEDASEDEVSTTMPAQDSASLPRMPSAASQAPAAAGVNPPLTLTARATLAVVAKRHFDNQPSDDDCVIYRYGSFCTGIEVIEAIEKVEIIQMDNAVGSSPQRDENVLDITVTCQGSLPKEVCSVILDAECLRPLHTVCNMVEPSKECQLVLRHFFNDSGIYCINVSMANDVSLASTSTKVRFDMGSGLSSPGTVAAIFGVLVFIMVLAVVAYSYKRFKSYHALQEDVMVSTNLQPSRPEVCSRASKVWKLLNRHGAVDDCPLLQDRPV